MRSNRQPLLSPPLLNPPPNEIYARPLDLDAVSFERIHGSCNLDHIYNLPRVWRLLRISCLHDFAFFSHLAHSLLSGSMLILVRPTTLNSDDTLKAALRSLRAKAIAVVGSGLSTRISFWRSMRMFRKLRWSSPRRVSSRSYKAKTARSSFFLETISQFTDRSWRHQRFGAHNET